MCLFRGRVQEKVEKPRMLDQHQPSYTQTNRLALAPPTRSGFRLGRASISLQTLAFYARLFRSRRANAFKMFKRQTRRGRREFDALFAFGVNTALDLQMTCSYHLIMVVSLY